MWDDIKEAIGPFFATMLVVIVVIVAVYIVLAMVFSFWPFSVVQKVVNADSMIGNYEWFYDQYNAIMAQKANYKAIPRGSTERTGMVMVLNNAIGEYNSKSRQITRNLWKANDLPYQIELEVDE